MGNTDKTGGPIQNAREMSRRDKRDREAQRADVAIRNPVQQPPLSKGGGTAKP